MKTSRSRPPDTPPAPCGVWFGPNVPPWAEQDFLEHLASERGVAVCCWPRDAEQIERLTAAGIPRLLLIGPHTVPPKSSPEQVWLREAASQDEIHDALAVLAKHAALAALGAH